MHCHLARHFTSLSTKPFTLKHRGVESASFRRGICQLASDSLLYRLSHLRGLSRRCYLNRASRDTKPIVLRECSSESTTWLGSKRGLMRTRCSCTCQNPTNMRSLAHVLTVFGAELRHLWNAGYRPTSLTSPLGFMTRP